MPLYDSAIAAAIVPAHDNIINTESRRALQDTTQQINNLINQQSYQQLKKQTSSETPVQSPVLASDQGQCLAIRGVYLTGISLLSSQDLNSIDALPENCIHSSNINLLTKQILSLYIDKGYITARVQFLPLTKDKELGIRVIEGRLERIEGADSRVNPDWLFPNTVGNFLNIKQLEQGLDQANRLQSNQVTMDILPGATEGGSIIQLQNQPKSPWSGAITVDNYGQSSTGDWISRASASRDSPFGISDFVSLSLTSTLANANQHYSRSAMLFYSIPYGNITISTYASFSNYLINQSLQINTVKLTGNALQAGMRADYMFYRNQHQVDSLMAQLTYKKSQNYFEDVLISVSSPTLTIAEIGYNHLAILPTGIINTTLSIEQGTTLFGADNHRTSPFTDSQYTKAKFTANLYQRFMLFEQPYLFNSMWYGQYSQNKLPGVEWLSLTDNNAIRGFHDSSLSADKGWYWRNSLSHTINWRDLELKPRIALDYGRVMAQSGNKGWQSAIGGAIGLSLAIKNTQFDIEINQARAIADSSFAHQSAQAYFRFSYLF